VSEDAARPKYSLIVSTRNRAQRLGACLDSIASAKGIRPLAELIVVDNGSTDETASVIDEFVNRTPGLQVRIVTEPQAGLSRARNSGVRASSAEFLLFTDDDCYLDGEYFNNLEQAIANNSFDYFSGNILLHKETYAPEGGFLTYSKLLLSNSASCSCGASLHRASACELPANGCSCEPVRRSLRRQRRARRLPIAGAIRQLEVPASRADRSSRFA